MTDCTEPSEQKADLPLPVYIGPTWQRDPDTGKFILPERTLGWEIAGWCTKYLKNPQDPTRPWRFTNEQLRFVLWWYAVDENGRWIYRDGVLQRLKGWGKDPLLAVISLVELVGPSRFDRWDDNHQPIGKPHPNAVVQIVAVSQSQTTNTSDMFVALMTDEFKSDYDINAGVELIRARGGRAKLQTVTSNYRTLEGNRPTFALLNEVQHWVPSNKGDKLYDTVVDNAVKGANRTLAITNAYLPGEGSVGEDLRRTYEDITEGRIPDTGFLYDSVEAHPSTPLTVEGLRHALPLIRGDSTWIDIEAVVARCMRSNISPARIRRMYLNQIVADEDALYEPDDWDRLQTHDRLRPNDTIVLGFDGGKNDDSSALVAIRVSDCFVQPLLVEEKPWGVVDWEVDKEKVEAGIHKAFREYRVVGFYSDVAYWESYITHWSSLYQDRLKVRASTKSAIAWDMRAAGRKVTMTHEALWNAIIEGNIKHGMPTDGLELTLRRHLLNTRRRENNWGVMFDKESKDSPNKVDAYSAMMIAYAAWTDYREQGKSEPTGNRFFSF